MIRAYGDAETCRKAVERGAAACPFINRSISRTSGSADRDRNGAGMRAKILVVDADVRSLRAKPAVQSACFASGNVQRPSRTSARGR
jgi:hypothetical protein